MKKDLTVKVNRNFLKASKIEDCNKLQLLMYEYLLSKVNDNALKYKEKINNKINLEENEFFELGRTNLLIKDFINEYKKYNSKKLNYSQLVIYGINLTKLRVKVNGYINGMKAKGTFNIFDDSVAINYDEENKGFFNIQFAYNFLKNYIRIQDKNGWQKYQWGRLVEINNENGIELYKFFKSFEWTALHNKEKGFLKKYVSLEELYEVFLEKNDKNEYKNTSYLSNRNDFEKRYLDPACESINNKSDLKLTKYENRNKRDKNVEKFYEREKKGYNFGIDFKDSDYFKYGRQKKIVENKEKLKEKFENEKQNLENNQNNFNQRHKKNKNKANNKRALDRPDDYYDDLWGKNINKIMNDEKINETMDFLGINKDIDKFK